MTNLLNSVMLFVNIDMLCSFLREQLLSRIAAVKCDKNDSSEQSFLC